MFGGQVGMAQKVPKSGVYLGFFKWGGTAPPLLAKKWGGAVGGPMAPQNPKGGALFKKVQKWGGH